MPGNKYEYIRKIFQTKDEKNGKLKSKLGKELNIIWFYD